MKSYKDYIEMLIKDEYINAKDGTPLKCQQCECSNIIFKNKKYETHFLVEYDAHCTTNDHYISTWAYGHWSI